MFTYIKRNIYDFNGRKFEVQQYEQYQPLFGMRSFIRGGNSHFVKNFFTFKAALKWMKENGRKTTPKVGELIALMDQ